MPAGAPLSIQWTVTSDASGNTATRTDFNGRTTGYGYDTLDRLVRRTPDARTGEPEVLWTYTATGRRATMTDATGVTVYGYDDRDRLVEKQTPWGTLTYGYGTDGNLASIRSSNDEGARVEYGYDELNRLETVTDGRMGGAATSYRYDGVGNLAGYTYANGVRTGYVYNSLNRFESVTMKDAGGQVLAGFGYTLGAAGNRTGVTEASGRTITYGYDELYRLTSETIANDPNSANGEIGYVYDDVGNRLSRTSTHPALQSQTAIYDANDRVAGEQYDANGNTTEANGHAYGWDAENRLTVLDPGTAGEVRYAYDGDGNRVAKTEGGVTTRYLVVIEHEKVTHQSSTEN